MTDFPCCEPMTDPEIPDSLVDVGVAGIGTMETQIPSLSTFQAQAVVRAVLAAALPRLRVQGCAKSDQICGDCNALPDRDHSPSCVTNIEGVKALIATATKLGRKLGRQEAAEEIALAFDREVELIESLPDDEGVRPQVRDILRARRAAFRDSAHIAREVATRTADARTDPSGHTDLPPTPDAPGSKRLPEEGDEWCCGTCQRIAWEANPMSREEQSAGETP